MFTSQSLAPPKSLDPLQDPHKALSGRVSFGKLPPGGDLLIAKNESVYQAMLDDKRRSIQIKSEDGKTTTGIDSTLLMEAQQRLLDGGIKAALGMEKAILEMDEALLERV